MVYAADFESAVTLAMGDEERERLSGPGCVKAVDIFRVMRHRARDTSEARQSDQADRLRTACVLRAVCVKQAMDTGRCACGGEMSPTSTHERDSSNDYYTCDRCGWQYGEMETWNL